MIKNLLKKIIPRQLLSAYHWLVAVIAVVIYRFPSRRLIVIGVTGTSGKTTTSYLIAKLLEQVGQLVGLSSTALFKVDKTEWLNDKKMTMLGRWQTQKLLRDMVKAGCKYAVIETSSEGILQHRHVGIFYDILVFTNLTPEHLEAHGGFDNYKNTKLKIFQNLAKAKHKVLRGQRIKKVIVANADSRYHDEFSDFVVDEIISFSDVDKKVKLKAEAITPSANGLSFMINGQKFSSQFLGNFNVKNILAAIGVLTSQNISLEKIAEALPHIPPCPGRIELINVGQNFTVIVDYAFTPEALTALYQTIKPFRTGRNRVVHLLGSTGGGRDKKPRPIKGGIAGQNADYVIVTNEDPYDEDPTTIIKQVAQGALQSGKKIDKNLFLILDRREAIAKCLSLAGPDDIVLITGKGSEQKMAVANGQLIDWDDRKVVREELGKVD